MTTKYIVNGYNLVERTCIAREFNTEKACVAFFNKIGAIYLDGSNLKQKHLRALYAYQNFGDETAQYDTILLATKVARYSIKKQKA